MHIHSLNLATIDMQKLPSDIKGNNTLTPPLIVKRIWNCNQKLCLFLLLCWKPHLNYITESQLASQPVLLRCLAIYFWHIHPPTTTTGTLTCCGGRYFGATLWDSEWHIGGVPAPAPAPAPLPSQMVWKSCKRSHEKFLSRTGEHGLFKLIQCRSKQAGRAGNR